MKNNFNRIAWGLKNTRHPPVAARFGVIRDLDRTLPYAWYFGLYTSSPHINTLFSRLTLIPNTIGLGVAPPVRALVNTASDITVWETPFSVYYVGRFNYPSIPLWAHCMPHSIDSIECPRETQTILPTAIHRVSTFSRESCPTTDS